MAKLSVSIGLPGLSIGVSDIKIGTPNRRNNAGVGPFLIISRANGLALTETDISTRPTVSSQPNRGERDQFWYMRPSQTKGAVLLVSASHGLALDEGINGETAPVLWSIHREPWQRWAPRETSDGVGYHLQAVNSGRFLSSSVDAEPGWQPWYDDTAEWEPRRKEWLFLMAYGASS